MRFRISVRLATVLCLAAVTTAAAPFSVLSLEAQEAKADSKLTSPSEADEGFTSLFDGKSLAGWATIESDKRWWKARDGMILGGSEDLSERIPHNTFLATEKEYGDFELRLKIRLIGTEGFVNSGIQFRSQRDPKSPEMIGYQADIGPGWWGKLYDESRRNRVLAEPADNEAVAKAVEAGQWVDYRIVAQGKHLQAWINGVPAFDYIEQDDQIAKHGSIAIQVHGDGKSRVEVKEISIRQLGDN